ncbi:long-chain fatty acid--CoA ligase [Corallococcus sp. H22C18031201]|uniref:acyl-CoA synthetase n=1 Tax=Citreicoccus inhibens TaxID=2849499 RepID=UPI000E74C655|nr:long-chain fatty acid--CoA ligase [Citreicoccus inhibens]MBU8900006.1 long-chain fatty acid--CoA ligase [Citreicoccus inhibens]RJS20030.1 long-chain fatty acid--CoA ligase [Corallococcus sp. H22C18031201]
MPIVHDWLARRAQLAPERTALIDAIHGGRRISWRAWDATAHRTALLLRQLGVERGSRVAVLAHNCVEFLDLLFACAKLGAILQPLNWRLSAVELRALLADAEPWVLVFGPEFRAQVEAVRPEAPSVRHWVSLGEPGTGELPFSSRDGVPQGLLPELSLEADAPWVLCYTGGSTGLPKAAILTHGAITANAANTVVSWGLTPDDVALLNAPLFHTGGLNVFTTPLVYAGGASRVCRGFDVAQVLEAIHGGEVNLVFGVPTMFIEMQRHARFDAVDFSRVKLLISGGAPCPAPVFERFFARGVAFKTGYGLTEAGPNNFWLPPEDARRKPGAVGVPLFHVEARLDGALRPGDVGELLLRGPHLCAGYWRRPEETARTFVEGWLRTGDLATRDEDGAFRIVGRSKDLIISGGENIYPAEVESVLAGHPDVSEVAVIGVPDARWGETPRALVVPRAGASLSAEALLAFCGGRLARYKTPRSVRFLEALPRTSAGKVDRRALSAAHGEA